MHFLHSFENFQPRCSRLQYIKNNIKANEKTIFKIILTILSVCGLFYQVGIIYCQFMSGKTNIILEIGPVQDETPPAVTMCFQGLFSMERSAKFNHEFIDINELYQDLLRNDSFEKYKQLYYNTFRNYTDENFNINGLDINEIFDNMSVKYKEIGRAHV